MKKYAILLFVFALAIIACSEVTEEDKRNKIETNKLEISRLQKEIGQLEKEISGGTNEGAVKTIVTVKKIEEEKFVHILEANGYVEAVKSAFISPETNGQIRKISVTEGQRVKKGQLLVLLNSKILQNSIEELKTTLSLAEIMFKKQKDLWDKKIGSEIQFLQAKNQKDALESKLKTLKSQLDMYEVRAPFSGIVDEIYHKEGEMASPGMQLIQLVDLSRVYINAEISENNLPNVKKGDKVTIEFPTFPDYEIKGNIKQIDNVINPQNRTFGIKLEIANSNEKLKPNIVAIVKIADYQNDKAIITPSIIVKQDTKGAYLYLVEDSKAKKVYISIGKSFKDKTEIIEGITLGDKVITEGFNLVTDGVEVKIN